MFYIVYLIIFTVFGGLAFIVLFFISAPYGRFFDEKWGPSLPGKWAWLIMESPAAISMTLFFIIYTNEIRIVPMILFSLFMIHYVPRDFIYPFWANRKSRIPVAVMIFAIFFNISNAYIISTDLFKLSPVSKYSIEWLYTPQFILGIILFTLGYVINRQSEIILKSLRDPKETSYKQPIEKGLFRYVSSPNYFGEIIQWIGWAVLTFSIAGVVFAFWTIANLAPRAYNYHKWYQDKFEDYPEERKALIPYLI